VAFIRAKTATLSKIILVSSFIRVIPQAKQNRERNKTPVNSQKSLDSFSMRFSAHFNERLRFNKTVLLWRSPRKS
jgi:hypothetical protein